MVGLNIYKFTYRKTAFSEDLIIWDYWKGIKWYVEKNNDNLYKDVKEILNK